MSTSEERSYFFYADILRTAAIVGVVVIHVSSRIVELYGKIGIFYWWIANIINSSFRWTIPVFVMLSGALNMTPQSQTGYRIFLKKRFSRIAMPSIFWTLIYFLWLKFFYHIHLTPLLIAKKLVFGGPHYHLYFLYVISLMYLIAPAIKVIFKFRSTAPAVVVISSFLVLGFVNSFVFYRNMNRGDSFFEKDHALSFFIFLVSFTGYFLAGHLISKGKGTGKYLKAKILLTITLIFSTSILTFLQFSRYGLYHFGMFFYDYFSPTTMIVSLLVFSVIKDKFGNYQPAPYTLVSLVRTISSASFGIYLSHILFLDILNRMVGILGTDVSGRLISLPAAVYMPVGVIIIFSAGLLLTLIMKRVPFLRPFSGYAERPPV